MFDIEKVQMGERIENYEMGGDEMGLSKSLQGGGCTKRA